MDLKELVEQFAKENGLSYSDSFHLLSEFDYDTNATQHELETRYRAATAVWESLCGRFGFQNPFPVRIPLPRGNRVYHQLLSLTLQKEQDTIRLDCSTAYISRPGSWADGAKTSISHTFECLPQVTDLTGAFEHWAVSERRLHSERIQQGDTASRIVDHDFFYNPASWTLHDFLDRKGASIRKAGHGTLLTLNVGTPLGYFGAPMSIYLLSKNGHCGAIMTKNKWPSVDFDFDGFQTGYHGDDGFASLPMLTESPFQFVLSAGT
jgi:hypothetical protein